MCRAVPSRRVRLPSRAFVGVVVFGLITVLVTIPYTVLVLADYQPAADAPHKLVFPEEADLGTKVFLVLASVFSIALLVFSWRALVAGARRDAERRRRHAELRRQLREYEELKRSGRIPHERDPGSPRRPGGGTGGPPGMT